MREFLRLDRPLLLRFPRLSRPSVLVPLMAMGLLVRGWLAWAYGRQVTHDIVLVIMDLVILGIFWYNVLRPLRGASVDEAALAAGVVREAPDGIITTDMQGIIRSFNPPAERLYGYKASEVIGRSIGLLVPEESRSKHSAGLRLMAGLPPGTGPELQVHGLRKDGSIFPAGLELTSVVRGGRRMFICVVRDITERKQAEEALMRYQLLSENTKAIVLFIRADGRILEANRAAADAYGIDRSGLVGLSYADLQAGRTPWADLRALLSAEPGKSVTVETMHRKRSGRSFPVEVTGSAINMGGADLLLCLVREITDSRRRAATQKLLHDLDHLILQKQPVEVILQHLCIQLAGIFGFPLVWVGLKHESGRTTVGACAGQQAALLDGADLTWTEGAAQKGLTEAFSVPLIAQDQTLGALTMSTSGLDTFDDECRGTLTALADQVSISILAARDQDQIRLQTAALETAANTVMITDRSGTILWVNPAWARLTGYAPEEAIGKTPAILKSGQHPARFYQSLWETILAGHTWHGEIENRRKTGEIYVDEQTITPLRGSQGEITHFIAIKQDVTDRRRHEAQLRHLALHDPLTSLPNRRALKDELERLVTRAGIGRPGALLLMDLDNFKLVNDTQGHAAGDQLLVSLSMLLRRTLRPADFLCRLGGDEFAALLEATDPEEARGIAERVRQAVGECRCRVGGRAFDLSVSVGVAPVDGKLTPDGVLALADSALYGAKDLGKNRTVYYAPGDERGHLLEEAGRWASRIKDALLESRFVLYFQPVVRLSTGMPEHYEALIRMKDEEGQIISPVYFLSSAEQFGLMPAIDRWVMDQVLTVLVENPDLKIFVNLSGQSLGDDDLLNYIEERIRAARLGAGRLCLEITETAAVRDLGLVQGWMGRLKSLGCNFALDDFGIGFSSFAYLRTLPADYVKIDGSFIRDLDRDSTCRSLVEAMKTVCHTLGKQVIAEWVENEEVAIVLRDLGVEHGQGFHWGRPSADALEHDRTGLVAD